MMFDFECPACGEQREELVDKEETPDCSACGKPMKKIPTGGNLFTTIVPDYPGAKKNKAGYVHTHGDRPATKVQSGPGGCVNPK